MSQPIVKRPIAIVGMACRLPGADNLREYWRLLAQGSDAVSDMPDDRLDRELYFNSEKGLRGRTYSARGGMIPVRPIDLNRVPLSADDLRDSDPCHQILCEVAADALHDSGHNPFHKTTAKVGVYVGHSGGSPLGGDLSYATLAEETVDYLRDVESFQSLPPDVRQVVIEQIVAGLRNRRPQRKDYLREVGACAAAELVARVLKLNGPQMSIDAACASSLVALSLGVIALELGEIDSAIVAGASFNKCDSLILFSHAQSCSAAGSRPFDESADGLISSEGYVALVVKTLDRAQADGDRIHAVIRGIGMSSDGRGRSLWAPRKEGQVQAMRRAYESGLDPTRVEYVEAHATSTQVGDATEVEALREFFRTVDSGRKIPIGSVKSNIGHTLETAGLAGLVKSVLAMQHSLVPASINVRSLNREIPWSDLPFFVAEKSINWPRTKAPPRRAAVNAFGIGGLNVHVVVDEYDPTWNYEPEATTLPTCGPASVQSVDSDLDPIAIIGRGVILPGASSIAELEQLIRSRTSMIADAPESRWRKRIGVAGEEARYHVPHCRGGYIARYEYDWRKFKIPPKQVAQANPLQFMLLDAARQALEEGGYHERTFDRTKVAVVVGSAFGSEFGNQLQVGLRMPELLRDLKANLKSQGLSANQVDVIGKDLEQRLLEAKPALLDETGSFTASTLASRVSKTLDLMGGAMAIDSGDCSAFAALDAACGLLRSEVCEMVLCAGASRSMDLPSFELFALNGILAGARSGNHPYREPCYPGEGVALLLLKRLSQAERDGDKVLGILGKVEATNLAVNPDSPRDTGYADPLLSQIGHTQSAQGVVSVVSAITNKVGERTSVSGISSGGLLYQTDVVIGSIMPKHEVVLKTVASAPVRQELAGPSRSTLPAQLYCFGAADPSGLFAQLESHGGRTHQAVSKFSAQHRYRLAIVANDDASLSAKILLATSQGKNAAAKTALEEQGMYFGSPTTGPCRIAFLFPGQGSQYPEMLRGLVEHSPAASGMLREIDRSLIAISGTSFSKMAWADAAKLGSDVWTTQAAMFVSDLLIFAALGERGIAPDVVCGHSFGEFAAMAAAGCWSIDQALRITMVRANAINASRSGHGGLLSIDAPADRVAQYIQQSRRRVFLTHYNAPGQTVVGGDNRSLAEFTALLTSEGLSPRPLPVPSAFHTPLLADTQEAMRQALSAEKLHPPSVPLLSSVTNRYCADPDELRSNLVAQMVEPVRWMQLVERLAEDGVNVFIEVGPQQVLTRLTRQVLGQQDLPVLATDHPKRGSDEMILRIEAALAVRGLARTQDVGPAPSVSLDRTNSLNPTKSMHEIESFDATQRRRDKKRASTTAALLSSPPRQPEVVPVEQFDATLGRRESRRTDAQRVAPPLQVAPSPSIRELSPPNVSIDTNAAGHDQSQLEKFLIDFVVEQTGYPAEMIDLDWDMEADLGIDSIKRAQLFGELREYFEFEQPGRGSFSLDQFRTLRQVIVFLQTVPGKGQWLLKPEASEVAPVSATSSRPASSELTNAVETVSNSEAKLNGHAAPLLAPVSTSVAREGLEEFLISFVVEQTGYPPEIVELDADLEADLGIDSIKKAQLFGELREHFKLPVENMSRLKLAEFHTLRQVLTVLEGIDSSESQKPLPSSAPTVVLQPDAEAKAVDSRAFLGQASQQMSPVESPEIVAMKTWLSNRADSRWSESEISRIATVAHARHEFSTDEYREAELVAEASGIHVGNVIAYRQRVESPANGHATSNGNGNGHDHHGPVDDLLSVPAEIASRYVLRMIDSPIQLGNPTQPVWRGAAAILGDNQAAQAIRRQLERDGVKAYIIAPTGDPTAAADELEQLWKREPIPHLFIVTPRDRDAATTLDESAWLRRRAHGVMTPFWVCQRWVKLALEAGVMEQATLTALVSLGGDFGLSGKTIAAESGVIAGLLKAIFIECWVNGFRTVPIKVIDAASDATPDSLVQAVWHELAVPSLDCEIAWNQGRRRLVRADKESATIVDRSPIRDGAVWVCTGGARGITAFVANELASRFHLKLHLIGTAPVPDFPASWRSLDDDGLKKLKLEVMQGARTAGRNPVKEWQNTEKAIEIDKTLRDFAVQGITAKYHSCDVSNRAALGRVLDQIRATDGPIEGVLHGAGVGKDSRFDRKDPEKVDQCFKAKIDGTLALMDLTRRDPLKHFIGFGSISGRFGANGHTDYSPANDTLCKLIDWYRSQRSEVHSVGFHWHAWGDVGMATKPETKLALEMVDMQFMPASEGLGHLLRELAADTPCGEVLITDERYHRMFYPTETVLSQKTGPAQFPLLGSAAFVKHGERQVAKVDLDPTREVFLIEHRLEDKALLPVVVGMEILAEAARKAAGSGQVLALHNIEAVNGLRFFSDRVQTAQVSVSPGRQVNRLACELTADFLSRDEKLIEANRGYLRGEIEIASQTSQLKGIMPRLGEDGWQKVEYAERGNKFYLGPPLRSCRKIRVGEGVLWGKIHPPMVQELAGRRRSAEGWIVPSAALDACLYAVGLLAWMQVQPGASLPLRFGKIALGRLPNPGEACLVEAKFLRQDGRFADFDFTLFGSCGDVILQVTDYRIVYLA